MAQVKQEIEGMRVGDLTTLADESEDTFISKINETVSGCTLYDYGRSTVPWHELDQLINATHGNPGLRAQIEKKLASLLGAPEVSLACKQEICRRLWIFGSDASLPSLQKMLAGEDSHAAEAACYAISTRPSAPADKVLRKGLKRRDDSGLVAIIKLLGDRRVKDAVRYLTNLANRNAEGPSSAAIQALGKIASKEAIETLANLHKKGDANGRKASHALLESGRELLSKGLKEEAQIVLEQLETKSELRHIRRGAKLALEQLG